MPTPYQQKQIQTVYSRFRDALANAKLCLQELLQNKWVVQALLFVIVGGAATFGAYYMFTSAANSATAFVSEVVNLAETVQAVTQLIEAASAEASLWVAGLLGGSMGMAAALLLSAIFPEAASYVMAAGAAGAYSGFTLNLNSRQRVFRNN